MVKISSRDKSRKMNKISDKINNIRDPNRMKEISKRRNNKIEVIYSLQILRIWHPISRKVVGKPQIWVFDTRNITKTEYNQQTSFFNKTDHLTAIYDDTSVLNRSDNIELWAELLNSNLLSFGSQFVQLFLLFISRMRSLLPLLLQLLNYQKPEYD